HCTLADHQMLQAVFGEELLQPKADGLIPWHSIKTAIEVKAMEDSFACSDQAIFQTMTWLRDQVDNGQKVSEGELYRKTGEHYRALGARSQSFKTIAGVGPHSSIIHFGASSDQVVIKKDDLILLDSGGYFASGFATDT